MGRTTEFLTPQRRRVYPERVNRGMNRVSLSLVVTGLLLATTAVTSSYASPVRTLGLGGSCSVAGEQASVTSKGKSPKTQRLVCVETISGLRWGPFTEVPSKPAAARALIQRWAQSEQPQLIADIRIATQGPKDGVEQELIAAVQARNEWTEKLNEVQSRLLALQGEQQNLPSQLSAATRATEDAKKTYDSLNEVARREVSALNALAGEYSAAQSVLYAGIGPGVACNFGFTQYCSQAQSYAAQRPWAEAVVARYNAQRARTESAVAAASSAYRTWESRYAEYKRLFDRQTTLPTDLAAATADVNHARGMEASAAAHANMLNERFALFDELAQSVQAYELLSQRLGSLLESVSVGSPGWQRRMQASAQAKAGLTISIDKLTDLWTRYAT